MFRLSLSALTRLSESPHRQLSDDEARAVAEGLADADDDAHFLAAWQHIVNSGMVWNLQGTASKQATFLVEEGFVHLTH